MGHFSLVGSFNNNSLNLKILRAFKMTKKFNSLSKIENKTLMFVQDCRYLEAEELY